MLLFKFDFDSGNAPSQQRDKYRIQQIALLAKFIGTNYFLYERKECLGIGSTDYISLEHANWMISNSIIDPIPNKKNGNCNVGYMYLPEDDGYICAELENFEGLIEHIYGFRKGVLFCVDVHQ